MLRIKKITIVAGLALWMGWLTSACGSIGKPDLGDHSQELKIVVTTTFIGDVVNQVVGEVSEITVLLESGQNPHAYQPTPRDMVRISEADVVFINGLHLEEFLDELLDGSDTDAVVVEVSEGVQALGAPGGHDHPAGYDPHVWFDPENVMIWTENIVNTLSILDPNRAEEYREKGDIYRKELIALDGWIQMEIDRIPEENRDLVTDHTSLGYFAQAYGLTQVGAIIPALTTEAETSGQELAGLIDTIREQEARAIFIGIDFDPTLAQRVAEETGVELIPLYFGSLSAGEPAGTYLDFMRFDVNAIVSALK